MDWQRRIRGVMPATGNRSRRPKAGPLVVARLLAWLVFIASMVGGGYLLYEVREHRPPEDWLAITAITALAVSFFFLVFTQRLTCPSCLAYAGRRVESVVVDSRPTHARVDGDADRRYKHNPTILTHEVSCRCGACDYGWTYRYDR